MCVRAHSRDGLHKSSPTCSWLLADLLRHAACLLAYLLDLRIVADETQARLNRRPSVHMRQATGTKHSEMAHKRIEPSSVSGCGDYYIRPQDSLVVEPYTVLVNRRNASNDLDLTSPQRLDYFYVDNRRHLAAKETGEDAILRARQSPGG